MARDSRSLHEFWCVQLRPRLSLLVPFVLLVPLSAIGTTYWSAGELFGEATGTATYSSSLAAFGVAILGGHLATAVAAASFDYWVLSLRGTADRSGEPWTPSFVGVIERIMYVYTLFLGVTELIVVWLVLKAVQRWRTDERSHFNAFLVGSLLSLSFGLAGAALIAGSPV